MLVPKVSDDKKQEVIKKLEGIRQRILDGEDFAELAKQYSEDPVSAPDGGDIGFFPRGMMIKEFDDVAFSLKVGEISDVIETLYGLHIIRVDEIKVLDLGQFFGRISKHLFSLWVEKLDYSVLPNKDPLVGIVH